MSQAQDNFKRGTAELLILHILCERESYGYEIAHTFAKRSDNSYTMLEGSMYPILFRLVDAGYVTDELVLVGVKRKRRYYKITEEGKAYYEKLLKDYREITNGIDMILTRKDFASDKE